MIEYGGGVDTAGTGPVVDPRTVAARQVTANGNANQSLWDYSKLDDPAIQALNSNQGHALDGPALAALVQKLNFGTNVGTDPNTPWAGMSYAQPGGGEGPQFNAGQGQGTATNGTISMGGNSYQVTGTAPDGRLILTTEVANPSSKQGDTTNKADITYLMDPKTGQATPVDERNRYSAGGWVDGGRQAAIMAASIVAGGYAAPYIMGGETAVPAAETATTAAPEVGYMGVGSSGAGAGSDAIVNGSAELAGSGAGAADVGYMGPGSSGAGAEGDAIVGGDAMVGQPAYMGPGTEGAGAGATAGAPAEGSSSLWDSLLSKAGDALTDPKTYTDLLKAVTASKSTAAGGGQSTVINNNNVGDPLASRNAAEAARKKAWLLRTTSGGGQWQGAAQGTKGLWQNLIKPDGTPVTQ